MNIFQNSTTLKEEKATHNKLLRYSKSLKNLIKVRVTANDSTFKYIYSLTMTVEKIL